MMAAVLQTACGGSGKTPIQPGGGALRLSCRSALVLEATSADGAVGNFELPSVTGGRPPYTTTCAPRAGSNFPMGTTSVSCESPMPTWRSVLWLCDSRFCVRTWRTRNSRIRRQHHLGTGIVDASELLDVADTYPFQIGAVPATRYTRQRLKCSIGVGGTRNNVSWRCAPSIRARRGRPEVLLLFEGVNNVRGLRRALRLRAYGNDYPGQRSVG